MSAEIIPFTGKQKRAIVVTPVTGTDLDICRAILCGEPTDCRLSFEPGPLWFVTMAARDWRRGLPIVVQSECTRRAGA